MSDRADNASSTNGLVWEDPPPVAISGRYTWQRRLGPLMDRPGQWARVHVYKSGASQAWKAIQQFKAGLMKLPHGTTREDWELTPRHVDGDNGAVYARYVGADNDRGTNDG